MLCSQIRFTWHSVKAARINREDEPYHPPPPSWRAGSAPCWDILLLIVFCRHETRITWWPVHQLALPAPQFPRPLLAHFSGQKWLRSGKMSLSLGCSFQLSSYCMSGCVGWHSCIALRTCHMWGALVGAAEDSCVNPTLQFLSSPQLFYHIYSKQITISNCYYYCCSQL